MRLMLTGIGALAGLCFYVLTETWAVGSLPERLMLFLTVGGLGFFAGLMVMAPPLGAARAAVAAIGTALPAAGLLVLSSLRYDESGGLVGFSEAFATLLLATLPWPFWIAAFRGNWADYATHFRESWTAVIRIAAGMVFTGLVWGILYLSDMVLSLVGLDLVSRMIEVDAVPFVVTGAVTGLAMAVVGEFSEVLSADLLMRLLRLLVPVVLGVMVLFLAALPLRGFDRVLGGLSVAGTLLAMAGVAVTLLATACDADEDQGPAHPFMQRAGQGLAALVVVPAGLAGWAIALRVAAAGWTPPRVAAAALAVVATGYGLGYLWSLTGGGRWRMRVRRVNLVMALGIVALAALWLTPVLDATALSARSQVVRFEAGRTPLENLDINAFDGWGVAGAAGLARLAELAKEPGQEALAARLRDRDNTLAGTVVPVEERRATLLAALPVVPPGAKADAPAVLAAIEDWDLREWQAACDRRLPDGRPACALVFADFLTDWPPDRPTAPEAIFLWVQPDNWLGLDGFAPDRDGSGWHRKGTAIDASDVIGGGGAAALAGLLDSGPVLEPVPMRRLRLGQISAAVNP